jgi:hypothetical protein
MSEPAHTCRHARGGPPPRTRGRRSRASPGPCEVHLRLVPADGAHDVAPGLPLAVDVGVVGVEDGVAAGGVVDAMSLMLG